MGAFLPVNTTLCCASSVRGVNTQYNMSLKVDGAYEEEQVTTLKPISNPVWNENFVFHIDKSLDPKLKIDLIQTSTVLQDDMHVEMTKDTSIVGSGSEPLYQLPLGKNVAVTLPLGQEQSVDLKLKAKKCVEDLDVRLSFDLADPEKEFLVKRKKFVARALKKALQLKKTPKDIHVPVIAILGSGGGIRAMTSLYGALSGLQQMHLLDCVTYMVGVSGSTWCMSTLYQDTDWSRKDMKGPILHAKKQVTKAKTSVLSKDRLGYYINALVEKNRSGQSVTVTDLWGLIIESFLDWKIEMNQSSGQNQHFYCRGQMGFLKSEQEI
ncbi:cytosolic phospholipase A2 zeta-like [Heptranchias perlo]|uniref:cytosolic phospholipase A2 zeta-like n=1 Tax=Heptranchias perlo TaxID=212740 RepID=UPI00355A9D12